MTLSNELQGLLAVFLWEGSFHQWKHSNSRACARFARSADCCIFVAVNLFLLLRRPSLLPLPSTEYSSPNDRPSPLVSTFPSVFRRPPPPSVSLPPSPHSQANRWAHARPRPLPTSPPPSTSPKPPSTCSTTSPRGSAFLREPSRSWESLSGL